MTTLTIGNSYSRIQGLSAADEKKLRKLLSYRIDTSYSFHSGRFGHRFKCLMDKHGNFPTGLLHRVVDHIPLGCQMIETRRVPQAPDLAQPGINGYKWQHAAVYAARLRHRGIITAPTGTGKSRAMAMLVEDLGLKTLIVVPSLEIKKQLRDVFDGFKIPNVTVENIDSKALQTAKGFDCLIIDEAHHVAAKTYQKLNKTVWNGIYYRYFFTATPFRNDTEETMLFESIAGNVLYRLSYFDAIDNEYIVPIEAYYIEIPKEQTEAYSYQEVYSRLVVRNPIRNLMLSKLLLNLAISGKSTLCLVREVAHGKILAELTGLPFVRGTDDESRRYISQFNAGEIKVLIGTTGILGEGVDTKPCEYVVIAGLGKAKSQFMQQVGRAVRTHPGKESAKVILVKDRSHKFLTRHFNIQRVTLAGEYGVTPTRLEITCWR